MHGNIHNRRRIREFPSSTRVHTGKMAGKVKEWIAMDIKNLISQLTGFDENEENFHLCEAFATSNLAYHRYLSVDSHAVQRSIGGIVTKFMIHGHLDISRRLEEQVNTFLNSEIFADHPQYDIQWSILSLLLNLANNPTSHAQLKIKPAFKSMKEKDQVDCHFYKQMCAYIHEGNEVFNTNFNEESNDEFYDSSDVEESQKKEESKTSLCVSSPVSGDELKLNKELRKEHIYRGFAAENWLKANIQHSWWHESIVEFRAGELVDHREKLFSPEDIENKCEKMSNYKVMREILWLLQSPRSMYFFIENRGIFQIRPGVKVSKINEGAIKSYLKHLCLYFNMIHDLTKFRKEVRAASQSDSCVSSVKTVPYTFEAYICAIEEFLTELQEVCSRLESEVFAQEKTCTLYSLNMELQPMLLKLHAIYSVHVRAVDNWKNRENWNASTRLLSVLYSAAMSSSGNEQTSTILKLFLKSFKPYLDIINLWLTNGQLEDLRNEFIIANSCSMNPDAPAESRDLWKKDFIIRDYVKELNEDNIEALPLLQAVQNKVLHAGKSMLLLHRLHRLSEISSQCDSPGCLYKEFIVNLDQELSQFMEGRESKVSENILTEEIMSADTSSRTAFEMLEEDIVDQLKQLNDPFLELAFKDSIPFFSEIPNKRKVRNEKKDTENYIYKRLSVQFWQCDLPIMPMMERILTQLIENKHQVACQLVKNIFQQDYQLSMHLTLIRAVFLMEAGDIMHQFCLHVFCEAGHSVLWANSSALTIKLEDCIDLRYPEYSSRFSIVTQDNDNLSCVASIMDDISLKYVVDWPLTLIFSPSNMDMYNSVFQFLLKVKWALWSLNELRFSVLEGRNPRCSAKSDSPQKTNVLNLLRFWLLHSVGSVHTYLMGQVLHSLGLELDEAMEKAEDLDTLIQVHNSYVEVMYTRCLLKENSNNIRNAILKLVDLSLRLHEVWNLGVKGVSEHILSNMRVIYIEQHLSLGYMLQETVDSGLEPHLAGLCMALNSCNLPR